MSPENRWSKSAFQGTPRAVARRLLGSLLVRQLDGQRLSGIIVEVEAYLSRDDAASHSARGLTRSNRSMFAEAGSLYVYPIHTHHCLNIVTQPIGIGSAILIRAIEPVEGLDMMCRLRQLEELKAGQRQVSWLRSLTSGPGRICQAMAVNRLLDGIDLACDAPMWLEEAPASVRRQSWRVKSGRRIGISQSQELPLRWFIQGHQLVSGSAAEHPSGRTWRFGIQRTEAVSQS
ncbi:MAG: DNA-3-methyladenine glycosylase [Pirellulaceae bacterium]|nr:DNA-3-methyladenine glycosylase [Pirellulaceae bacterium]